MLPKISSNVQKALRAAFAAAAGLAMILQSIAYQSDLQANSNYFEHNAILPTLALLFALLAAGIGTVEALLSSESTLEGRKNIPFAFLPTAIGFAAAGFYHLSIAITDYDSVISVLLLLAALYSLLESFVSAKLSRAIACLGFAAMIACAGLTGYHYFDATVEMNAPAKVMLQSALLIAMLFFTTELRCTLSTPIRKLYTAISAWCVAIGALTALPIVLAYLTGKIDRQDYLVDAILVLGITITAAIRLLSLYLEKKEEECTEQEELPSDPAEESNDADTTSNDTTI